MYNEWNISYSSSRKSRTPQNIFLGNVTHRFVTLVET